MVREKPKEFYMAKPSRFGNGARLKAFKDHIDMEMIIMTKDKYKNFMKEVKKSKEVSDKESIKNEKALAKKWMKTEDDMLDRISKCIKENNLSEDLD